MPRVGAVVNAVGAFRANGHRLTVAARGLLVAGVAPTAVAGPALLGLPWNWLMPIILIASGVFLLAGIGPR